MLGATRVVQYWAGYPKSPNSKWQRFLAIIQRCQEQGWRNYLVWSRMPDDPALVEPFTDAHCEIILQPRSRRNFDPASVRRVQRLLRRLGCDVFHCHNDHTSPLIGAALARTPVRIWSKLAMSAYYERGVAPAGIHRWEPSVRLSGILAHRVLAVSDAVRQEVIDLGIPAAKVKTLRCPVDLSRYERAEGSSFRAELGMSRPDLLITAVGRAAPVKGWDVLVRAFQEVAPGFPAARLALVGGTDGGDERAFAQMVRGLVQEAGLSERIQLVGRRSDIPACLAGSDVFVLPSRSEGQPLALMEAMASRLPCVAAAVGGVPETITDGENGLLFPRENVEQLVHQLRRVLSDAALRRRLGNLARQSSQAFGIEAYVEALFSLYGGLLETGGGRRGR